MAVPRLETRTPAVLAGSGLIGLGGALAWELTRQTSAFHLLRAAAIGMFMLWLVLELRVTLRPATGSTGEDRGTAVLYPLARLVTAGASLLVPSLWNGWNAVQSTGLGVFAVGCAFRLTAIRELGRFYSHRVRRIHDHQIVSSGPYRVVRHPAYLGVLLAHAGFCTVFFNVFAALALVVLLIPAVVWRIRVEEPALMKIPAYAGYAHGRAHLLPGIW